MPDEFYSSISMNRLRSDEHKMRITFLVFALMMLFLIGNLLWLNTQVANNNAAALQQTAVTRVTPVPSPTIDIPVKSGVIVTPTSPRVSPSTPAGKDFFVPLGTGSTQADEWEDIPGAVASLDLGQFTNSKQVMFEASVSVPTANQVVSVRLYNKTDQHPVWYSEVSMNTATAYLISQPVIADNGTKTYQVQMKTQLKAPANLTQSRIHIVLK